ncbi:hypothetical protein [Nocardia terpenica]|uniref:hypothetical protein n=1 Tax=Nocardia terpenica TaxID=455432 RepID=UPI000B1386D3|nr:hypothetical protein [Nocardia terpenica]NQE88943.1 hypothetical protein [Nocardia terpenica]
MRRGEPIVRAAAAVLALAAAGLGFGFAVVAAAPVSSAQGYMSDDRIQPLSSAKR